MEPLMTWRSGGLWTALLACFAAGSCTAAVDGGAVARDGTGAGTGTGSVVGTGAAGSGAMGTPGTGGTGMPGTGSVAGGGTGGGGPLATGGNGNQPPTQGGNGGAVAIVLPRVDAPVNPGFVVARRLNRTEYNNTVVDLLGTKLTPAADFPADDLGAEFTTVGSALSLSPTYVLAYEKSAHALVNDLFADATRKARVVTCNVDTAGDTCAQTVLTAFAKRAWRRPVTTAEVQGLLKPVTTARTLGATPTEGLKHALAAVLLSPFFVFKLEIDPDPASTQARRLTQHELATRLSYALWSSMPDATLSAAADANTLGSDAELKAQIDRMLADPRAGAILDTFAAEWFDVKELETHDVEQTVFPRYTPALAKSMRLEARRYLEDFLRSPRPVNEMLNARFTYLDTALATHYGLTRPAPAAGGLATDFVRVDTATAPRAGLLTLGALLMTTSMPSRTSPVKRGEFVFRRLLCATVPAPPPDVPTLPETAATTGLTLRQRTELHRKDIACSPCHNLMDPIGFGLENYDALGAYRTKEGTETIDASGTLPNGTTFNGAVELAEVLARDPRFPRCTTSKFMIFAVGRLLNQKDDATWVDHLAGQAWSANGSLASTIRTVLMSESFRSRQPRPL